MDEGSRDAVAALDGAVDRLLAADLSRLSGQAVTVLLESLERVHRRLSAMDARVVGEVESRSLAGDYARSSATDLLVHLLRVTPAEARARVRRAGELTPRVTATGEPLPPLLPVVADAVSAGEVSTAHVAVISDAVDAVPAWLSPAAVDVVEATLVDAARHEHPGQLRRTGALLVARLDRDGEEPRDDEVERRRDLSVYRNGDGSGALRARLTPEALAVIDTVLDALSAPVPSAEGEPDPRTAGQRRHDALVEAGTRLLRSGSLPAAGGVPVTILVRTTPADLANPSGVCLTSRGDLLRTRDLEKMAGEAEVVPVLIVGPEAPGRQPAAAAPDISEARSPTAPDIGEARSPTAPDIGEARSPKASALSAGAVLAMGRSCRLATRAQRFALAARDGGCCFPGCDRPAAWTEVHHVVPWQLGGPTDIDNLCLLCRFHHREFEARGWQVEMSGGVPQWAPPPWLDPARTPRRNVAHHPPDLDFGVAYASGYRQALPIRAGR